MIKLYRGDGIINGGRGSEGEVGNTFEKSLQSIIMWNLISNNRYNLDFRELQLLLLLLNGDPHYQRYLQSQALAFKVIKSLRYVIRNFIFIFH